MLLAFDIGNTNIVIGGFIEGVLRMQWRLTSNQQTADEVFLSLKALLDLNGFDLTSIDGVVISSVVPSITYVVVELSQNYLHCDVLQINMDTKLSLVTSSYAWHELGADRIVNGLAAWRKFGRAAIIVDLGTAATIDAISHHGHYLGGVIAPGLNATKKALTQASERLPSVELVTPSQTINQNTKQCMQAGIMLGYVGLIKELIERCSTEMQSIYLSEAPIIISTGGIARIISPLIPTINHDLPDLTLEGLFYAWLENQS